MQGFNRYYPPDYDPKDPSHKGNLNRLAGKSAAKPVVRFEMPFNVWCLHCASHIAQGVRFNARKERTGRYLSSPIFSFTMTCHLCAGIIVVVTNPKETRYDVLSGAKKRVEEWAAAENGTFEFDPHHHHHHDGDGENGDGDGEGQGDPIYRLEREATQKAHAKDARTRVSLLLAANERQWADPYAQSQKLRRGFRAEKARLAVASERRSQVEGKYGLGIEVLDRTEGDDAHALEVDFEGPARRRQEGRFREAAGGALFEQGGRAADKVDGVARMLRGETRTRSDPFNKPAMSEEPTLGTRDHVVTGVRKRDAVDRVARGGLVAYGSDEEE